MSQFFASGGPSTGASASASVLPMNIYTVKGFGIVNKAEIDVFLELSCLFNDPAAAAAAA